DYYCQTWDTGIDVF
nr:immunoglobulin light chain junction region [Macaca mulatta]MOV67218.1 immunoglobulin light chain junction region [Macaca mulatta]MOV69501.1 immunoglobulin light chain junction region [Macaca mulatta]